MGLDWLGIKFDQEKNTSDDIELLYDKCVEIIKKIMHTYVHVNVTP